MHDVGKHAVWIRDSKEVIARDIVEHRVDPGEMEPDGGLAVGRAVLVAGHVPVADATDGRNHAILDDHAVDDGLVRVDNAVAIQVQHSINPNGLASRETRDRQRDLAARRGGDRGRTDGEIHGCLHRDHQSAKHHSDRRRNVVGFHVT